MRRDEKMQEIDLKKQQISIIQLEIKNLKQDDRNICSQIKTYQMKICKCVENTKNDINDKNDNDNKDDETADKLNNELDNVIIRKETIERQIALKTHQIRVKQSQISNLKEDYKNICWKIKTYPWPTPIYFLIFKK